jgi:hypothetical protein
MRRERFSIIYFFNWVTLYVKILDSERSGKRMMQFVRYMRVRIACTVIKNVNYESLAAASHHGAFVSEEVGSWGFWGRWLARCRDDYLAG